MAENQETKCTGDCMRCNVVQRQYCASQIAYNNMNLLSELLGTVEEMKKSSDSMRSDIDALGKKIEAIQSNEGELINPIEYDDEEPEAQVSDTINNMA